MIRKQMCSSHKIYMISRREHAKMKSVSKNDSKGAESRFKSQQNSFIS